MDTYYQDPKKAAKQLTADLRSAIEGLTVNAPDWESRDAAEMARWLLFPGENGSMRDYISVTQRLVFFITMRLSHYLETHDHLIVLSEPLLIFRHWIQILHYWNRVCVYTRWNWKRWL